MRLAVDTDAGRLTVETADGPRHLPLYSPEAFAALSRVWVNVGWELKYAYGFTWFGRPVIQLPEDLIRIQEVIYRVRPDVVIETGVAHGGSLVFYASLFQAMGRGAGSGRVIGVDVEIRPHNRKAIEDHPLAHLITLVEGDSVAPATLDAVRGLLNPDDRVLVLLDSCHAKAHVLAELRAYSPLVSVGSYIVATDGVMADLAGNPRGRPEWADDNPQAAARAFAAENPAFVPEEPPFPFNEGRVTERVTHWPSAYLRRAATA